MSNVFDKSIFSFVICDEKIKGKFAADFETEEKIGCYTLLVDNRTPLYHAANGNRELVIFGYAVDVFSGEIDTLAESVLKETQTLADVIECEKHFGGKYVIFYSENGKIFCLGDATCSVPVFYSIGLDSFICCTNPKLIIDAFALNTDSRLQKIRDSGPLNQAMPFDVTPYKQIKQLIPNHYLDVADEKAIRFVNSYEKQNEISPQRAAEITAPMIEKITEMYLSRFKVYCPLTSGRDSRVVYAFLKNLTDDFDTYTVWKDEFKSDDQDWTVPVKLTKIFNTNHEQIYNEEVTPDYKMMMDSKLGVNAYPDDAFALTVTVNKHYKGSATIEGDIIGQVGKCSLHRDIPLSFATPAYFRCKLHNYSNEAKTLLKAWLDDIKNSKEKVNPFDLFSAENRLGVWASHTHLLRNTAGLPYVNIFNSRSIIYVWTAVDRARRMKSEIHVELIKLKASELLQIPFEQDKSGLVNLAKSNKFVFYFASFAKFYVQRIKFLKNKH